MPCPACGEELPAPTLQGSDRLHGLPGRFEVAVCARCGSGRTLPMVPADELGALYPGDYNPYGFPSNPLLRALAVALYRFRYWRALRSVPLVATRRGSPGRLLDVGGGRGDVGVVLGRRGWRVTSLDPSPEACATARRRGVEAVEGTLLETADRLEGGFDAVLFQHSLEHVTEPREELAAAARLLRPGGAVLVSLPNFASWQARRFGADWLHLDLPRHRSHLTPAGLRRLLERSGYEVEEIRTGTGADSLPMSIRYRVLRNRPGPPGRGGIAMTALIVLLAPLSVAVGRLAGDGELLHAIARLPDAAGQARSSFSTTRQ